MGEGIGMGNTCKSWLIHVNVWQKPLQYCKVISLQLIKINEKKKRKKNKTCESYDSSLRVKFRKSIPKAFDYSEKIV